MIPKIIHYCWFGPNPIYPLGLRCIEGWKRAMPDWTFVFWNEDSLPPELTLPRLFIKKGMYAFASDYMRLYAIATQGGLYLDTDAEVIRPLDPLLGYQQFLCYERENRPTNGICGGMKGAAFFVDALQTMTDYYTRTRQPILAPDLCIKVLQENTYPTLTILPQHAFYPYNPYDETQPVKQLMFADIRPDTYIIHHWAKGWSLSLFQRAVRFVKERLFKAS